MNERRKSDYQKILENIMPRKDPEQKLAYNRMYQEQHKELIRQKALDRYYAKRDEINAKRNAKLREQRATLRDDPEAYAKYLEKRRIEYSAWREANLEHYQQYHRAYMEVYLKRPDVIERERLRHFTHQKKARAELRDSYVKQTIRHGRSYSACDIPQSLVDAVKELRKIQHKLKESSQ